MDYNGLKLSRELKVYIFLNFLACVGMCICAVTASKIVDVGYFKFPCANIFFALLTFPITDIISELWGRKYAKRTVYISFAAQAFFVLSIQLSILLPSAESWKMKAEYELLLGTTPRFLLASMIAYITAGLWDVFIYDILKNLTRGRLLWIRNNISTFTSQFINSSIFIFIAFYGTMPIIPLIMGSVILKIIIAAADTPLVYFGVNYIHKYLDGNTEAYQAEAVKLAKA